MPLLTPCLLMSLPRLIAAIDTLRAIRRRRCHATSPYADTFVSLLIIDTLDDYAITIITPIENAALFHCHTIYAIFCFHDFIIARCHDAIDDATRQSLRLHEL